MLSLDQKEAINEVLKFINTSDQKEMVIEGSSGSGKSYLVNHIITAIEKNDKLVALLDPKKKALEVLTTATTNKAASVLSDITGTTVGTIHSLLGLKVYNNNSTGDVELRQTNTDNKIKPAIVIIDEASYIDKYLLSVIRLSTPGSKLIYIGDPYQLICVGATDCPVFNEIPVKYSLTSTNRFKKDSPIFSLGQGYKNAVVSGNFPMITANDKEIKTVDGTEFARLIDQTFKPANLDINNAKIIAWSNIRVQQYNEHVKKLRNNTTNFLPGETVITNKPILYTGGVLCSTDGLVHIDDIRPVNMYGLTGSTITISVKGQTTSLFQPYHPQDAYDLLRNLAKEAKRNKNWKTYFSVSDAIADLRNPFASTVYKAQGATYEKVFIDLYDIGGCNDADTLARMLYVAITRASKEVILYDKLPDKFSGLLNTALNANRQS